MFTKEEKKILTHRFWSQFDDFCDTIPELAWRKKKWILHDTKISHIALKFDIKQNSIMVAIELNHKSEYRRLRVYDLIERYRVLLNEGFDTPLLWDYCYITETGQEVCRIYVEKVGIDFQKTDQWPVIYEFFASNMRQMQDNFLEIQEALKEEIHLLEREE